MCSNCSKAHCPAQTKSAKKQKVRKWISMIHVSVNGPMPRIRRHVWILSGGKCIGTLHHMKNYLKRGSERALGIFYLHRETSPEPEAPPCRRRRSGQNVHPQPSKFPSLCPLSISSLHFHQFFTTWVNRGKPYLNLSSPNLKLNESHPWIRSRMLGLMTVMMKESLW